MIADKFSEPHFSVSQLATLWRFSRHTIRRMVMNEPDVLRLKIGPKGKHTTYSVPQSVARRIHSRLSA